MVKYKIVNEQENIELPVEVELKMNYYDEPCLIAKGHRGDSFTVAILKKTGHLHLCGGLPRSLGLKVVPHSNRVMLTSEK